MVIMLIIAVIDLVFKIRQSNRELSTLRDIANGQSKILQEKGSLVQITFNVEGNVTAPTKIYQNYEKERGKGLGVKKR